MDKAQQEARLAIWQKAKTNGYQRGTHRQLDEQAGLNSHNTRTEREHDAVLDLYVTWRWCLRVEEYEAAGQSYPDLDRVKAEVLCQGAPPLTLEEQKDFLRFYLNVKTRAEQLYRGLQVAGIPINAAEKKEVYRDIILVQRRQGGRLHDYEFIWSISERWVKGNRDPINKTFAVTGKDHSVLLYSNGALMLILAIADGALFGINSLNDLWQQEIPEGNNEKIYRWNDSWKKIPIARLIDKAGNVSPTKPMSKATFKSIFKDCLQREGYVGEGLSRGLHQIRRQVGKRVNAHYTETERSQHILHSNPRIFGQQPDNSVPEFFQGLSLFREEGAPTKLSHKEEQNLLQSPKLHELDSKKGLTAKEYLQSRRRILAKLRRKKLASVQRQYITDKRDWKVLTKGKIREESSSWLSGLSNVFRIVPERARLAEKMRSRTPLSSEGSKEAMKDFFLLLTRDYGVFYRPGEAPVEGKCPFCQRSLDTLEKRCRRRLKSELVYCYYCAQWLANDQDWNIHCSTHLPLIGTSCASFTYCNTLIRPAHCPFCLGDPEKEPRQRLTAWTRDVEVIKHVETYHNGAFCGLCGIFVDPRESISHLADQHGLQRNLRHTPTPGVAGIKVPGLPSQPDNLFGDLPACQKVAPSQDGSMQLESLDDFMARCVSFSPSPEPLKFAGVESKTSPSKPDQAFEVASTQCSSRGEVEHSVSSSAPPSPVASVARLDSSFDEHTNSDDSHNAPAAETCTTIEPCTLSKSVGI
ncbi:putative C2H2-type domain-containing protein [Seiridium unicorne]|uniref:C2H2-type domain-containing protein n=1 Tax=Seiridium unicorne TaxID=138068 RepID=A0ABR2UHR8_9PEZI